MARLFSLLLLAALGIGINSARAEVVSLDVHRREPFLGGMTFGDVGPYEVIAGVARFAVDPGHPRNSLIVDLPLAPRNKDGKVEFESDFYILAPKDSAKGNRALLYDVNNRGNKLALRHFNSAAEGNEPLTAAGAGNGFLFRRGYTVVWCGWIGELLSGENRMLLRAPVATDNGKPIRGVVRYEMVTDTPATSLPLSRREGHGSYPPTDDGLAKAKLTWKMRPDDPRAEIPRAQWRLERMPIAEVKDRAAGALPQIRLHLAGGFRPGYIYELVAEAEGPIVQGLGLAATRDLVSFLRYQEGGGNPLTRGGKSPIARTHGYGVSQSGRFLRHFTYQGFNADEKGRRVFDGLIPHVSGGGLGFFNHRFAQPTRHNAQHEEHDYPTDIFPFTYGDGLDPYSGRIDGILKRLRDENPKLLPKVMHTQSAAEYWHRSGSLVHTDPEAKIDVDLPDNVRVYAFGCTQHGPAADPPGRGVADNLHNPGDYRPFLRALLDALDDWVKSDATPPPSVYPRIDQKTLVSYTASGFPALPGVRYPDVIQRPAVKDYGPRFRSEGIITLEPPTVLGHYEVRVPRSDADGNDVGTLNPPEAMAPLATYTGWNLRRREAGAEGMLMSLTGSFIPFPTTPEEAQKMGDPRRAVTERYNGFASYQNALQAACERLQKGRYLLAEDAERALKASEKSRKLFGTAP
jgi:hypothetical protein